MVGECLGAFHRISRFNSVQEIQVRNFGIHDDQPVAGELHDQVRLALAGLGLLAEIAVSAHARRLDDASEGLFAPASARLIRAEHAPELQRFVGERLALQVERFQVFLDLAERRGMRRLALLQPLLVSLELFLQRLDQCGDRLLALG